MENERKFLKEKIANGIKKTKYFDNLAKSLKSAFEMHKGQGRLWEGDKRDWGNVSEHCLVVTARVETLSDLLKLTEDTKKNIMYAAALHDFSKRREKELKTPEGGITWEQYREDVSGWSQSEITKAGFSKSVAELTESVGHDSLVQAEALLNKNIKNLSDADLAFLVMHYVDNYTQGAGWVIPTDGTINEIDARVEKDKNNPTLQKLREESKYVFNGRTYIEVMKDTGHKIEQVFVKLIQERSGIEIEPLRLPEYIDGQLKDRIDKQS